MIPGKQALKRAMFQMLKRPPLERAFASAFAQTRDRPSLHRSLVKVVPQPESYRPDEVREVERDGLRWRFRPFHYFQWHHYFRVRDHVLDALLVLAVDSRVIFDVGANIGLYGISMAHRTGAQVFCFEPNPETYAALTEHIALNPGADVRAFDVALGAEPSVATLEDPAGGDLGKFSLRSGGAATGATVKVRTLDEVVKAEQVNRVDLIKIDVEGFEPDVLLGARGTIERDAPNLCVELTARWYAADWPRLVRALEWRHVAPYRYFEITPRGVVPFDLEDYVKTGASWQRQVNVLALRPDGNAIQKLGT